MLRHGRKTLRAYASSEASFGKQVSIQWQRARKDDRLAYYYARGRQVWIWQYEVPRGRRQSGAHSYPVDFFTMPKDDFRPQRLEISVLGEVTAMKATKVLKLTRLWLRGGPVPTDIKLMACLMRG